MAEHYDPNDVNNERPDDDDSGAFGDVPVDQEPMEVEAPRRAASAQFVVDADVSSQAAMREAMDPANQSLADALRLSFRVLQIVILVLVVLFFMSGFQTVGEGQSGVLTRWGKVVPVGGEEALSPGLKFSRWPYPAGEFVIFDVENRQVDLSDTYWPDTRGRSIEEAAEHAQVNEPLHPGGVGYVVTRDGDVAHVRLSARYEIDNVVNFVNQLRDSQADRIVQLALQRATVRVAASMSLQEIVDFSDAMRADIQTNAQQLLDAADCGIRLSGVTIHQTTPPLAIVNAFGEVQLARAESDQAISNAQQTAHQRLVSAVGERFEDVMGLINDYEDALQTGEEQRAETILVQINDMLDSDAVSGEVAQVIYRARAFRAQIESSLGNEARRFASLRPAFQEHPELVVQQRWMRAYSNVLAQQDAEVYFVPPQMGMINVLVNGLHEIRELRQQLELDRKEEEAMREMYEDQGYYVPWAQDMQLEGPGRQLQVEDGRVRALRQPGAATRPD